MINVETRDFEVYTKMQDAIRDNRPIDLFGAKFMVTEVSFLSHREQPYSAKLVQIHTLESK